MNGLPQSLELKVGETYSLESAYDLNGTCYCCEYKFIGVFKNGYKESKNGYRRDVPEDFFIFENLNNNINVYKYSVGTVFSRSYYDEHNKILKLTIGIDRKVFANTLEDLKKAIGWQETLELK